MDEIFSEVDNQKAEIERLVQDMKLMDDKERSINKSITNPLHIHLFPIGYFQFPIDKKEKIYQVLNIGEQAKASFNHLFDQKVIPVANIYHCSICEEGFVNGKYDNKGIESWRIFIEFVKVFMRISFIAMKILDYMLMDSKLCSNKILN